MRSNCALYVDVGYLLASAATRVTGTSLRNGIHVEYAPLIRALAQEAERIAGIPLLRVHWYDSARDGVPDAQQQRIGELPKVKLRLGRFGMDGQQKGVDLRIGLDLVAHARNAAAEIFFLVSGDDDLTEAVEEAQVHGVQVVVLAVPNADNRPHGVSRHLIRAADELVTLPPATIDDCVIRVERPEPEPEPEPESEPVSATEPRPEAAEAAASAAPPRPTPSDLAALPRRTPSTPAPAPAPTAPQPMPVLAYSGSSDSAPYVASKYDTYDEHDDKIDAVVAKVLDSFRQSASAQDLANLAESRPSIPQEIDRALLLDLSDGLGVYDLNDTVRFRLRARFWEAVDAAS